MTPERVLQHTPLVLDQRTRERYFDDGFLVVPGHVGGAWLDRLRAVVASKIDESRACTTSDDQFDLAPDHSAEKPNIRRLRKAIDRHPELWSYAKDPSVVDLVADLLGPDIRFHSSKLNFKWSEGGEPVRWLSLDLRGAEPPRRVRGLPMGSSRARTPLAGRFAEAVPLRGGHDCTPAGMGLR